MCKEKASVREYFYNKNKYLGNTNFIDQIKLNKFYYLVIKWCEIGYKMA